jgi:Asfivirus mRNA-capping enzyme
MNYNTFQQKRLDEIIESFAKGKELEIRFTRPDENTFKRVFEDFLKAYPKATMSVEQSISVMTERDKTGMNRKEIFFKDGVKQNEDHNRKKSEKMLKMFDHTKNEIYRISIASEDPIPEFGLYSAHRIRLKLRCSVLPGGKPLSGNWRFDFTVVIQLEKQQFSQLKSIKEKIFPNKRVDPKKFLEAIPDASLTYEFEIEYMGSKSDLSIESIVNVVSTFTEVINPEFEKVSDHQGVIKELAETLIQDKRVAQIYSNRGFRSLANQPKNLTRAVWINKVLPNIDKFYASDKADGERCFVKIEYDGKKPAHVDIILSDRVVDMTKTFTGAKASEKLSSMTILDAEIVNLDREDPEKSKHPKLYLFDTLVCHGALVSTEPFEKREGRIDQHVKALKNTEKKVLIRLDKSNYAAEIKKIYTRKTRAYPIDGLILTPAVSLGGRSRFNKPNDYFDMEVYKWKPSNQLSVDFLILKPPKSILGKKPYIEKPGHELYFLFSGINPRDAAVLNLPDLRGYGEMTSEIPNNGNYFPIHFSHSAIPYSYIYYHKVSGKSEDLHMQIGEFIYDIPKSKDGVWILERTRPDKAIQVKQGFAYGNNYQVAEEIFNIYLNPLDMVTLTSSSKSLESEEGYFLEEKQDMYKPLTKFNNFVKAQQLRQFENFDWVVDLAAGRGADLFTYNGFEVKNALFADVDQAALEELGDRKWNLGNTHAYVFSRAPESHIRIFTMQGDLYTPAKQYLSTIESRGYPIPRIDGNYAADGVAINLALHYICKDAKSITNVADIVDGMLKKEGLFVFNVPDGKRIFDLLEKTKTGDSYDLFEDKEKKVLKYSIKKTYKDTTFKTGLSISLIHPFSRGQYYDEPLCDVDAVIAEFEKRGYKLQQKGSFIEWREKFHKFNPRFAKMMSENDKKYASLYTYVTLIKK